MRRTKIRSIFLVSMRGKSETSVLKEQIQALLRKIVILRDGGCILRFNTEEAGNCGGYTNAGDLILQAEHLHTRANSASFADPRLVVCMCKRHHIYWKPQYPDDYYRIVKGIIGKERTKLLLAVQQDYSPHKMDWQLEKLSLEQYLKRLE